MRTRAKTACRARSESRAHGCGSLFIPARRTNSRYPIEPGYQAFLEARTAFPDALAHSVDWIESANNYSLLHCRSNDYVFSENLTSLERRLDPDKFRRAHRCHIVNVTRIVAAHAIAGGVFELELQGGTRLKTGRQYSEGIRRLLKAGR